MHILLLDLNTIGNLLQLEPEFTLSKFFMTDTGEKKHVCKILSNITIIIYAYLLRLLDRSYLNMPNFRGYISFQVTTKNISAWALQSHDQFLHVKLRRSSSTKFPFGPTFVCVQGAKIIFNPSQQDVSVRELIIISGIEGSTGNMAQRKLDNLYYKKYHSVLANHDQWLKFLNDAD